MCSSRCIISNRVIPPASRVIFSPNEPGSGVWANGASERSSLFLGLSKDHQEARYPTEGLGELTNLVVGERTPPWQNAASHLLSCTTHYVSILFKKGKDIPSSPPTHPTTISILATMPVAQMLWKSIHKQDRKTLNFLWKPRLGKTVGEFYGATLDRSAEYTESVSPLLKEEILAIVPPSWAGDDHMRFLCRGWAANFTPATHREAEGGKLAEEGSSLWPEIVSCRS